MEPEGFRTQSCSNLKAKSMPVINTNSSYLAIAIPAAVIVIAFIFYLINCVAQGVCLLRKISVLLLVPKFLLLQHRFPSHQIILLK